MTEAKEKKKGAKASSEAHNGRREWVWVVGTGAIYRKYILSGSVAGKGEVELSVESAGSP